MDYYAHVTPLDWAMYEFATIQYDYRVHDEAAKRIEALFKRLAEKQLEHATNLFVAVANAKNAMLNCKGGYDLLRCARELGNAEYDLRRFLGLQAEPMLPPV